MRKTIFLLILVILGFPMLAVPTEKKAYAQSYLPDLTIYDISWSPNNPEDLCPGNMIGFRVHVRNQGTMGWNHSVPASCYIDEAKLGTSSVPPPLNVGQNQSCYFWWNATKGSHLIRCYVDPWNEVFESDETNNERRAQITINEPPFYKEHACVISNVRINGQGSYALLGGDGGSLIVSFQYQIWKPDDFYGYWSPKIIVNFGTNIPERAGYTLPKFVGPPSSPQAEEDWGKSYPGITSSRTVSFPITPVPALLPGHSFREHVYFGFEPSYYNAAHTLERLRDGTIELSPLGTVELKNSLVMERSSLGFGTVYGSDVLTDFIAFSTSDYRPIGEWSVSSPERWINIEPSEGSVAIGRVIVEVRINTKGVSNGGHAGNIIVKSDNIGSASIPVSVNVVSDTLSMKIINVGFSGALGGSFSMSGKANNVPFGLTASLNLTAGISLPVNLTATCEAEQGRQNASMLLSAKGTPGGRIWMHLFGYIHGQVQGFGFNYPFTQVDLFEWAGLSSGASLDFNRLITFAVPLHSGAECITTTPQIPLYNFNYGVGNLTFSISFDFACILDSYLAGNITISGNMVSSPVTASVVLTDTQQFEHTATMHTNIYETLYLNISSNDMRYLINKVTFWLDKITFHADLGMALGSDSAFSLPFEAARYFDKNATISNAYKSVESSFSISAVLPSANKVKPPGDPNAIENLSYTLIGVAAVVVPWIVLILPIVLMYYYSKRRNRK